MSETTRVQRTPEELLRMSREYLSNVCDAGLDEYRAEGWQVTVSAQAVRDVLKGLEAAEARAAQAEARAAEREADWLRERDLHDATAAEMVRAREERASGTEVRP
jgi:hypothetical protein